MASAPSTGWHGCDSTRWKLRCVVSCATRCYAPCNTTSRRAEPIPKEQRACVRRTPRTGVSHGGPLRVVVTGTRGWTKSVHVARVRFARAVEPTRAKNDTRRSAKPQPEQSEGSSDAVARIEPIDHLGARAIRVESTDTTPASMGRSLPRRRPQVGEWGGVQLGALVGRLLYGGHSMAVAGRRMTCWGGCTSACVPWSRRRQARAPTSRARAPRRRRGPSEQG